MSGQVLVAPVTTAGTLYDLSGQVRYFLHQYCHQAPPSDTFLSNPADEILRDSEQTWDSFVVCPPRQGRLDAVGCKIDTEPGAPLTLGDIMDGFPLEGEMRRLGSAHSLLQAPSTSALRWVMTRVTAG